MNPADYLNDDVALIDDHQAVELIEDEDMLRRVIVCCDCGLVHLMSIDAATRKAYFVREDGPLGETVRERGRNAGHHFTLIEKLNEERERRMETVAISTQLKQELDTERERRVRAERLLTLELDLRTRAEDTIKSLSYMLGWENVPPRESLERNILENRKRLERAEQRIKELEGQLKSSWQLMERMGGSTRG